MVSPTARRPTFHLRQLMVGIAGTAVVFASLVWAERAGFSWWVVQAVGISRYFYPRFGWAAGAASLVALIAAVADRRVWRLRSLWMLSPIAIPILLLEFGILFHDASHAAEGWTMYVIEWSPWLLLPLGLALFACFRTASSWIIILGLSTAAAWFSLGSQVMSFMSVTNRWL